MELEVQICKLFLNSSIVVLHFMSIKSGHSNTALNGDPTGVVSPGSQGYASPFRKSISSSRPRSIPEGGG